MALHSVDISCIINTCNHESHIAECINAALNQVADNLKFEVIVVDDGSSDRTPDIVEEFGEKITFLESGGAGQSGAINLGLKHTRAEVVVFCDGDDYFEPGYFQIAYNEFQKYPNLSIAMCSRRVFSENTEKFEQNPELHNVLLSAATVDDISHCKYGTSRTAVRRERLDQILPLPELSHIGADFALMELLWLGSFSSLPQCLVNYRVHQNNLFHSSDAKKLEDRFNVIRTCVSSLKERVVKHSSYDPVVAQKYFLYFDTLQKDAEVTYKSNVGTLKIADILEQEILRYRFHRSRWSILYKLYKLLRLPLILTPGVIRDPLRNFAKKLQAS